MSKWFNPNSEALFQSILLLKNIEEAKRFFRDLLSEQEIMEFSKRWRVARMLDENIQYTRIQKATGLSSTTVARISKWLNKGMGGYRMILDRMNKSHHRDFSAGKRLR